LKCPQHGRWVGEFQTTDPCWPHVWKDSKPKTAPPTSGDEVSSEVGGTHANARRPTSDEALFGTVHDQAVALVKRAFNARVVYEGARR
jgi:hypothetical protein